MKRERKPFGPSVAIAYFLIITLLLSACGVSSNGSSPETGKPSVSNASETNKPAATDTASPDTASQKLTDVTFVTLPVTDSAMVVLADSQGIFKKNGLNVNIVKVQTGPATTSAIVSGAAQFSQSNYATLISAKMKGTPIEIVAEAARAQEGFSAVITGVNSSIKEPKDLLGKRIATAVIGGIGPIAINQWLKDKGIDYTKINWVQMSFPEMGAALETNRVDAAWVVEPFVTKYTKVKDAKARVVFDVFSGPTAKLPIAAYAANENYVKDHPDIVEAFVKSVQEAAALAQKDPTLIKKVLPSFTSLPEELVNQLSLEEYPSSTDIAEIQRVAKAMQDTGVTQTEYKVDSMIWKK
ncbi:ABC transporter substrate-binding protein [Ferviditalea candida]|uniref:ABC transporter substrate-binding protein n=1 Tax=Ferviditalea candida TaxID=3108399 RepID=A0ABU5ZPE2_9BACL|nr:ABC transporter substrate-binding protein [Paenibacillaceae bacterium T2]